jgi:hypothetical protein
MQVKGLECVTFNAYHTPKLTYCKSLDNTKQKITKKQKDKSIFRGMYDYI